MKGRGISASRGSRRQLQLGLAVAIFVLASIVSYFSVGSSGNSQGHVSICLAVDVSGSTNDLAGKTTKIIAAKNAATKFVSILNQSGGLAYEIAVIEFSSNVTVVCNLTSDEGTLLSGIQSLSAWGSTAMGDAIVSAVDLMLGRGGKSSVILMTDGKSNAGTILPSIATDYANRQNVVINTVGFGKDTDKSALQNIANTTGGNYSFAASGEELVEVYKTLAESFVSPALHYGSRILMLIAIPLILFLPEIERGAGTVYKTIVYTVLKKPEKLPAWTESNVQNVAK
jgi:Ca-activated chloride channel family protein